MLATFSVTAEIFSILIVPPTKATAPSALTHAAVFSRGYFRYRL
jgi:hypothetical protein